MITRHPLWPPVRASIGSDDLTVTFTTEESDDLNGAMATCTSTAEAVALAQFVNRQGCPVTAPLIVMNRPRTTNT